jgi:chromosome segregation ATPase
MEMSIMASFLDPGSYIDFLMSGVIHYFIIISFMTHISEACIPTSQDSRLQSHENQIQRLQHTLSELEGRLNNICTDYQECMVHKNMQNKINYLEQKLKQQENTYKELLTKTEKTAEFFKQVERMQSSLAECNDKYQKLQQQQIVQNEKQENSGNYCLQYTDNY